MENKRIIAALSGGVDSSVAAAIYVDKGYEVIGVTLKMKTCDDTREKTKSCCGIDDNIQAKLVAEKLGIKHYFLDVRKEFKEKILNYAWNEYSSARTPNPCVWCNFYLKFGSLIDFADEIGAIGVITGHYAILDRTSTNSENVKIYKGKDDLKNQTYFLSALTQKQLNRSYMPLGELTKKEVRIMAEKLSLPNAEKEESQDSCFGYKGESFAETLARVSNSKFNKGKFIDANNKILGEHTGFEKFTIGQRKGLGIALGAPAYVSNISLETHNITLTTDKKALLSSGFIATKMNWLDFPSDSAICQVQTRYRQEPTEARVEKIDKSSAKITFLQPVLSVTPGQAAAFYNGSQLIAGGWIEIII